MLPRNIAEQLSSAREQALIGDYPSAIVYYEGVLQQIKEYATHCRGLTVARLQSLAKPNRRLLEYTVACLSTRDSRRIGPREGYREGIEAL